jgi:pilus assembly protein CpaB
MFVRNLLLVIGALCLLGGIALSVVWYNQMRGSVAEAPGQPTPAVLVAKRAIATGTLLRPDDLGWKDVRAGQVGPGSLLRGQVLLGEFIGAVTRRPFAADEPIVAADVVKPNERQFLSAVLKPGTRAVSISVDAPQSVSGLVLPGDRVDVILTQSLAEPGGDVARKTVAETVLRDVRVIAVDQSLSTTGKPPAAPSPGPIVPTSQSRIPKTVTFALTDRQAERLFVAAQLGRLHLSVRPLEASPMAKAADERPLPPTWAYEVSPALGQLGRKPSQSNSTVEKAVRLPPGGVR